MEALPGFCRHEFVEGARWMACLDNALYPLEVQYSESTGVVKRTVELFGGEALTESQNTPSLTCPVLQGARAEAAKEFLGTWAHPFIRET